LGELLTTNAEAIILGFDISGMSAPGPPGWDIGAVPDRYFYIIVQLRRKYYFRKKIVFPAFFHGNRVSCGSFSLPVPHEVFYCPIKGSGLVRKGAGRSESVRRGENQNQPSEGLGGCHFEKGLNEPVPKSQGFPFPFDIIQ
jgi:hypothetical protein